MIVIFSKHQNLAQNQLSTDFKKIIRQKTWFLAHYRSFSLRAGLTSGIGSYFELASNHAEKRATYKEQTMAHKKVERKKELDRRRKRREKRLKARLKEAKSGA